MIRGCGEPWSYTFWRDAGQKLYIMCISSSIKKIKLFNSKGFSTRKFITTLSGLVPDKIKRVISAISDVEINQEWIKLSLKQKYTSYPKIFADGKIEGGNFLFVTIVFGAVQFWKRIWINDGEFINFMLEHFSFRPPSLNSNQFTQSNEQAYLVCAPERRSAALKILWKGIKM